MFKKVTGGIQEVYVKFQSTTVLQLTVVLSELAGFLKLCTCIHKNGDAERALGRGRVSKFVKLAPGVFLNEKRSIKTVNLLFKTTI